MLAFIQLFRFGCSKMIHFAFKVVPPEVIATDNKGDLEGFHIFMVLSVMEKGCEPVSITYNNSHPCVLCQFPIQLKSAYTDYIWTLCWRMKMMTTTTTAMTTTHCPPVPVLPRLPPAPQHSHPGPPQACPHPIRTSHTLTLVRSTVRTRRHSSGWRRCTGRRLPRWEAECRMFKSNITPESTCGL